MSEKLDALALEYGWTSLERERVREAIELAAQEAVKDAVLNMSHNEGVDIAYASGFSAGAREMRDICAKTVLNIYWDAKGSEERAEIWLADQICSLPLPAANGEKV